MLLENVVDALEKIEKADRGNARSEKVKELDSPELRRIFVWSMSPFVTFGVKKTPDYEPKTESSGVLFEELEYVLRGLATRVFTGNDAKDTIQKFLSDCSAVEAKWAERIIKQDLRLNLDGKTINSALDTSVIPLFKCALATKFEDVKEEQLKGKWVLQPKFDGGRCIAFLPKDGGPVALLSRTGKTWENFQSIRDSLQRLNESFPSAKDRYLDGEVITRVDGRIDFQAIQKTMHAKSRGTEIGNLEFYVFDAAEAEEWDDPKMNYSDRLKFASDLIGDATGNHLQHITDERGTVSFIQVPHTETTLDLTSLKIKSKEVRDPSERLFVSDSWIIEDPTRESLINICAELVAQGYEGAMLRRADTRVSMKRSKSLLKVKLFEEDEFEITGTFEGQGKYVGMLGGLNLKTKTGVAFEAGSGFDDRTRKEMWDNRDALPGKMATIKYQRYTNDGVPLLPIYRAVRHPGDIGHAEETE